MNHYPHFMAVTQQLARLDEPLLNEGRADVERLDEVCSFRALEMDCYVDLDWAPAVLEGVAEMEGMPDALQKSLRDALKGDNEVNPAYRDHPDTIWEHPVASLVPARVAEIARDLELLNEHNLWTGPVVAAFCAANPKWGREGVGAQYISGHFGELLAFYRRAAEGQQAVVMWWD